MVRRGNAQTRQGIAENLEGLQKLLIDRAVGKHASENRYQAIRDQLLSESSVKELLPQFVLDSPNLGKFWRSISKQFPSYRERASSSSGALLPSSQDTTLLLNRKLQARSSLGTEDPNYGAP